MARRHLPALVAAAIALLAWPAPAPPAAAAPAVPRVVITTLSRAERAAMTPSVWRPGCPVSLASLRRLSIPFIGFDGRRRRGVLVVHDSVARDVARIFLRLRRAGVRIRRMRPIEVYHGNDGRSIRADNTSAFNCRRVSGSRRWSRHAYGTAIDVNPIENPYVSGGRTSRPRGAPYLDRNRPRRGMAIAGRAMVRAFDALGWGWGGRWRPDPDYQHFSKDGR